MSVTLTTQNRVVTATESVNQVDVSVDEREITASLTEAVVTASVDQRVVTADVSGGDVVSVEVTNAPVTASAVNSQVDVSVLQNEITIVENAQVVDVLVSNSPVDVDVGLNVQATIEPAGLFLEQFTTDDDLVVGDLVAVNASGNIELAASNVLWRSVGVSSGIFASSSVASIFSVQGRLTTVRFSSAPAIANNGDPVYLSGTAGLASLTPGPVNEIEVGILATADGMTTTPAIIWAPILPGTGGGGGGGVAGRLDYIASLRGAVPNSGTQYLFAGDASTFESPLVIEAAATLDGATVSVDKPDGSRNYAVEFLVNGSVEASLNLNSGSTKVASSLAANLVANDELSIRMRRTSGTGKSDFRNVIVAFKAEES